jgi:hypothetical protein
MYNIIPFFSKNVLETELGEALNDKGSYLKSDYGTQLINRALKKCGNNGISKGDTATE